MKKIKVKKIGLRKKTTAALWTLLIGSVLFGVYKNFTAIDQHTIHEQKVIETKVMDTHLVSSYVEEFAKIYYTWEPQKESLENRDKQLEFYLPDTLQQINQEMIRSDIPTRSTVTDTKIWKVEPINQKDFKVTYSVDQEIEESKGKEKERRNVSSTFSVNVGTNGENQLTILSNPVMAAAPKKMIVKSEPIQDDMRIKQETKKEIEEFLNTFFKIYPSAKKTELHYYVAEKNVKEIHKDYVFSELKEINYSKAKDGIQVRVVAVYIDNETKAILPFEYELTLKKTEKNWIILDGI